MGCVRSFNNFADLKAAKTRIKDLENAWDDAEKKMRPMNPGDWKTVDKLIDHALAQLRTKKPDSAGRDAALKTLVAQMESMQPPTKVISKGGPLGDLTASEKIARDTLKLVETGDFKTAKSRIKDLETAWDAAEEKNAANEPGKLDGSG